MAGTRHVAFRYSLVVCVTVYKNRTRWLWLWLWLFVRLFMGGMSQISSPRNKA